MRTPDSAMVRIMDAVTSAELAWAAFADNGGSLELANWHTARGRLRRLLAEALHGQDR